MQDRAPTKPNRYAVYDDNHNFLRYEYHERADEPTQEGDPLNKANLLPDAVATALGLAGDPQVKDALAKIKTLVDDNTTLANSKAKIATGSYTGTGTFGSSNPCSISLNFRPRFIALLSKSSSPNKLEPINPTGTMRTIVDMELVPIDSFGPGHGFWNNESTNSDFAFGKKSSDGKTYMWYGSSENTQFNTQNYIFRWVAIGWEDNI